MRLALILGALACMACASAAPPPGGPEDKAAPVLVRVTPESAAVNARESAVNFVFDETINDRGTGAQEVSKFFLISPVEGAPSVAWHRSRIDVRPRHGFRENTAYTVTLLPGLSDLRGNVMKTGHSVIFSTGPVIPTLRIEGIVFDWQTERPVPRAFIEAMATDSTVYIAQADSAGHFSVGPLPSGSYLVRGIIDQNGNRALDRSELSDTARVLPPLAQPVELLAILRDTLPARILTVEPADSLTLRVTFDRPLDPAQSIGTGNFRLVRADSSIVALVSVRTARQDADSAKAAVGVREDSLRRADTTTRRAPPVPDSRVTRVGAAAREGTRPSRPPPSPTVTLRLATPLAHATTYRLSASGIVALSGRTAPSDRSFTTRAPPAPKPASDSVTQPPRSTPRAPARPE